MLKGKCVLLGVSGGIAAYKAVEIASRLVKLNADVHVAMTDHATEFVTPLTFRTITGNKVTTNMFDEPAEWDVKHISISEKADLVIIAPATANIVGKLANGIADDFLTTTLMAVNSPVLLCPSMNTRMYENPFFRQNINNLKDQGYLLMEPGSGFLACRDTGKGRLPEPFEIVNQALQILNPVRDLEGKKILITAGPTREEIDPVRFLSNYSSGKMGFAIAEAAKMRGADVTVVSGPVSIDIPKDINVISVVSAEEMLRAFKEKYLDVDYSFFMAAVADYRPESKEINKIKKADNLIQINFVRNPDIAKVMGDNKKPGAIHIGACAETQDITENALLKLKHKNFDIIMANDVTQEGAGFMVDTNIATLFDKTGKVEKLSKMTKRDLADKLIDFTLNYETHRKD